MIPGHVDRVSDLLCVLIRQRADETLNTHLVAGGRVLLVVAHAGAGKTQSSGGVSSTREHGPFHKSPSRLTKYRVEGFVQVPGRKCSAQSLRAIECALAGANHIPPGSGTPVPIDKRL